MLDSRLFSTFLLPLQPIKLSTASFIDAKLRNYCDTVPAFSHTIKVVPSNDINYLTHYRRSSLEQNMLLLLSLYLAGCAFCLWDLSIVRNLWILWFSWSDARALSGSALFYYVSIHRIWWNYPIVRSISLVQIVLNTTSLLSVVSQLWLVHRDSCIITSEPRFRSLSTAGIVEVYHIESYYNALCRNVCVW